jgi:probable F420-dependent oxidoreductase
VPTDLGWSTSRSVAGLDRSAHPQPALLRNPSTVFNAVGRIADLDAVSTTRKDPTVQIEAMLTHGDLTTVGAEAQRAELIGFAAAWSAEINHDPFLPIALAAEHTEHIELGTGVAVAFARSPLSVATTAWDLQRVSDGRFVLGLGSQVKAHIERRFGMPWSNPARRMREYILAVRAIWDAWQHRTPLAFQGEFYRHDLMPPAFVPGEPLGTDVPRVVLAAVGERMCEVAGECADGVFIHPFSSPRYLREFTVPALDRGRTRSDRQAFTLHGAPLLATGIDPASLETAVVAVRRQIAFYASTPSYRGVFALHGWGDLADELQRLSRSGQPDSWERMGHLITDEILDEFAIVAPVAEVADRLHERFGDVLDRVQLYAPYDHDPMIWQRVIRDARAKGRAGEA